MEPWFPLRKSGCEAVMNLNLIISGLALTIIIGLTSIAIGLVVGLTVGTLHSKFFGSGLISKFLKAYVIWTKGAPLFVQLLLFYFGVPSLLGCNPSPLLVGILTLGTYSGAYLSSIIRGSIDDVPESQWGAGKVLGYSRWQTLRLIILPQALVKAIPGLTNEFVACLQNSSLLMIIGVNELTKIGRD